LDRPETDFGTNEIVVPPDESGETSPKLLDLLRQGEELYSDGQYQQAIHVWTRILFIDRGNAEARGFIDKAKQALAELQRKLEAEVATSKAEAGAPPATDLPPEPAPVTEPVPPANETEAAPLPAAPSTTAPSAKTVVIRVRRARSRAVSNASARRAGSSSGMALFLLGVLVLFAGSAVFLRSNWESIVSDGPFGRESRLQAAALSDRPVPVVPDLSELHYFRGERLFAEGRYREALAELRLVDRGSKVMADTRSLVLRIEDRLLRGPSGAEAPDKVRRLEVARP
jgi:tetratricopeptide (TPR) repeat protein